MIEYDFKALDKQRVIACLSMYADYEKLEKRIKKLKYKACLRGFIKTGFEPLQDLSMLNIEMSLIYKISKICHKTLDIKNKRDNIKVLLQYVYSNANNFTRDDFRQTNRLLKLLGYNLVRKGLKNDNFDYLCKKFSTFSAYNALGKKRLEEKRGRKNDTRT